MKIRETELHSYLITGETPIVLAHRGYATRHPENTMASFAAAIDLGIRHIETDVQATADGEVVVFHDDRLERLTGCPGLISEITWNELRQFRINDKEPVPRLEDALSAWPNIRFNIDAKCDGVVRPLLDLLKRHDAWDRVCIGSFSGRRLEFVRNEAGPKLCTSMGPFEVFRLRLASFGLPTGSFRANCAQVPPVHRGLTVIDRALVDAAHARNLPVHAWTINDPDEMNHLLALGVDGIVSDDAVSALAACASHNKCTESCQNEQ